MSNQVQVIADTYWVEPGQFMAGEYPGARDDDEARCKLRWLLRQDIDLFIDLTEAGEASLKPYAHLLAEEAAALGSHAEHHRASIPDMGTVSPAELERLLEKLDAALGDGRRVYVHCWGGVGRTGTVVGCYLRRRGLSGVQALQRIAELRSGTPKGHRTSPETEAQRQMVIRWE